MAALAEHAREIGARPRNDGTIGTAMRGRAILSWKRAGDAPRPWAGSMRVDGNLYAGTIVPIDPDRPPFEADELLAPGLPAGVGHALRLHIARVLVEVLAQDVGAHAAADRGKEVGRRAAPRGRLPAPHEGYDGVHDIGHRPRLQLLVADLLHQLPAAVDEPHAELLVLHVAPGDVERRGAAPPRLPAQHHRLVGAAHQAVRAADRVEHVPVAHLARVVHHHHRDVALVGERLERPHVLVVRRVDALARGRAHRLEGVDHDHPQVAVGVGERSQLLDEAAADALGLDHAEQAVVGLVAEVLQARLDAAERVLQAEVENRALLGREAPERLAQRHVQRQVEPQPRLTYLRVARHEREPARDEPLHHPPGLLQRVF